MLHRDLAAEVRCGGALVAAATTAILTRGP